VSSSAYLFVHRVAMALRWLALGAGAAVQVYVVAGQSDVCAGRSEAQCGGDCRMENGECRQICFRQDTAYAGDMPGQPLTSAGSQEHCRQHCENTVGCVHFSYWASNRACHLHDGSASRQAAIGAVSGQPDCRVAPTSAGSGRATGSNTGGSSTIPLPAATSLSDDPGSTGSGVESMPGSVGSAMQVGSVQAGNSFSGLFSQASSSMQQTSHLISTQVPVAIGGIAVLLVGAFALATHRRRDHGVESPGSGAIE